MNAPAPQPEAAQPAIRRLPMAEFIALMGMMFATIAFSIDAMLPALPEIAGELSPGRATLAQLVVTSFVLGMGLGTAVTGPLSDRYGRKQVIVAGAALYITGAVLAWAAPSLEMLLVARALQGLGAAGPRVVSLAMVRDLYTGREMAKVVSFAMMVFTLFPAVAPLIGSLIIAGFGWRAIFLVFVLFSLISVSWLTIRQPETLPPARRRGLTGPELARGLREILGHRQMQLSILVQTLIFGMLFGVISSIQQVFEFTYDRAGSFPLWFGVIALCAAPATVLNGRLVMRLGMRPLIRTALWVQLGLSSAFLAAYGAGLSGDAQFAAYIVWTISLFGMLGFTIGNLNALALEPMGHIAGLAASIMGALATVGGAILGAGIGQAFNGTPVPIAVAAALLSLSGALVMQRMPREAVD